MDADRLLAVDLGLKTGLALYGGDGKLIWYRSTNFGSPKRLKSAVHGMLKDIPDLRHLIVEGRGELGDIWLKECKRRGIAIKFIGAEKWRQDLLYPRQQRRGVDAKHHGLFFKTIAKTTPRKRL